jgi:thymidine phosphorylase
MTHPDAPLLTARRIGLHTQHQPVVLLAADSPASRAEGLGPHAQVLLCKDGREVTATLYQVTSGLIGPGEAGLSEAAWTLLGVAEGDVVSVRHPPSLESFSSVRRRIYGQRLTRPEMTAIVGDVVGGRYMDAQLSAFLTACTAMPLDIDETAALTQAMAQAGERLSWKSPVVIDKHCVGGLPGNRTTPIVVAIAAACGLTMPKTSSRAITSPAGTADTMEVLAPVELSAAQMRRVVEAEGGCIVWGGAMNLSPADDVLIRVERVLDMEAQGQVVASVLSKKVSAGATHVILDLPVGPTAKLRSADSADSMVTLFTAVAERVGLTVRCLLTDGGQPVGRGIGPALEARDVMAVLRGDADAPQDLARRAVILAGAALELAGAAAAGQGEAMARASLQSGAALTRFERICEAQGGMRDIPLAAIQRTITAAHSGRVTQINNRKIARLAKLAGAPDAKAAGIDLHVHLGDEVAAGQPLATLHAEAPGEAAYALEYAAANQDIILTEA